MAPVSPVNIALFIVGCWIAGHFVNRIVQAVIASRPNQVELQERLAVCQTAAILIGAAMNNPQYIARMQEIRERLKDLWKIKIDRIGIFPKEEREQIDRERQITDEHIRDLESQASVSDLFRSGRHPYIDLAFSIHREVLQLQRKGTTFSDLDSERMMNSKDPEAADAIVREQKIREFARP